MSPEQQVVTCAVAIVLFLLAAWRINSGLRPAQELGWIALAVLTLVPLVAAIKAS